ncbi:hypothetical protein SARC_05524 [Sphaeroforma arctica JP610]|uniref:Uncharacterized protein n=1 Tax=Sphaeroforma arctica JP610 TaxID=667725 RepID=A0A0L0FZD9_9EUKA|nr:hypothetical protein SARC_05524 [Sphaeroforma arctica JP610]KNC82185.1 hypothetical protein SARC_05524 [Sphaeroforma arctica JP610]|eukprot:XP_014156087.1 hypothetical protein SARC_05524 [Sphaeroforma arctica JP610]
MSNRRPHTNDHQRGDGTVTRIPYMTTPRGTQQWQQRTPPSNTTTTCGGCQAQAPPGLRHIPRCHNYRAATQDNRGRTLETHQRGPGPHSAVTPSSTITPSVPPVRSAGGDNTTQPQVHSLTDTSAWETPPTATDLHLGALLFGDMGESDPIGDDKISPEWSPISDQP